MTEAPLVVAVTGLPGTGKSTLADLLAGRLGECVCSNLVVHRSRVEGRERGIPGWHEIGWDHVERMRAELVPLTVDRIVVDAVRPSDYNLGAVLSALRRA